jgi:AraC-like DNA-binding protein
MQLTFAQPHSALSGVIGTYYLIEIDNTLIEDAQRADIGQLRFLLQGSGQIQFAGAAPFQATRTFITGPTTISGTSMLHGPIRMLGVSLLHNAWGGLIQKSADQFLNRADDAATLFKLSLDTVYTAVSAKSDITAMAPVLDAYFRPLVRPLPKGHTQANELIRAWLASETFPRVETLYAAWSLSERQMTRIANRYWGAPPKSLAKKYSALRTALGVVENHGTPSDAAIAHYADRPHLIREVKRATGQTPRQLGSLANPLLRYSLLPENYRELEPSIL